MAQAKTVLTPEEDEKIHAFVQEAAAERFLDTLIEGAYSDWNVADTVEKREAAWHAHRAILTVKAGLISVAQRHAKRVGQALKEG